MFLILQTIFKRSTCDIIAKIQPSISFRTALQRIYLQARNQKAFIILARTIKVRSCIAIFPQQEYAQILKKGRSPARFGQRFCQQYLDHG
jgi:hypothetical protein